MDTTMMDMPYFSEEEITLICIYDPGNRMGTIVELKNMMNCLMPDEQDLKELAQSVIRKLQHMTDEDYEAFSDDLTPDCFNQSDDDFDGQDSAYGWMTPSFYDLFDPDCEIE